MTSIPNKRRDPDETPGPRLNALGVYLKIGSFDVAFNRENTLCPELYVVLISLNLSRMNFALLAVVIQIIILPFWITVAECFFVLSRFLAILYYSPIITVYNPTIQQYITWTH